MTNKELIETLKQYPDDMLIGSFTYDPDHVNDWEIEEAVGVSTSNIGRWADPKGTPCLLIT